MAKKKVMTYDEMLKNALDVEKPYDLPENWVWTKLGEVFTWSSGGTPSRKESSYYDGSIAWVKSGDLNDGYIFETEEKITEVGLKNSSAKVFPINSVIIAMYGATIGKISILGVESATNQACACAKPNIYFNEKYLFYYLKNEKENFIKKGKGGAQPNISQEVIKGHQFPIPPIAEQQRIVETIENMFFKLDKAKELIEESLETYENRRSAILHKAFTGELTKNWRQENGIEIDNWEETTLGEQCKFIGGGTPSKRVEEYWDGDLNWASVKDIKGQYLNNTIDKITYKGLENSASNVANVGDLIIITRIEPGKPIISRIKTAINQDLKIVKTNISIKFTYYLFIILQKEILSLSKGSTVLGIRLEMLNQININLPTIQEQQQIVTILDTLLEKEDKSKELINLLEQIEVMKKTILAKAFRGELGTNNPEEESGLELLKEIIKEKCDKEIGKNSVKINSVEELLSYLSKKKSINIEKVTEELDVKESKLKFYIGELLDRELISVEKGVINITK